MKDIMVIGFGEIGSAIGKIEVGAGNDVYFREMDIFEQNKSNHYDVCHVCIPYKDETTFIRNVLNHLVELTADVVIIHSTVEVGTTRKLYEAGVTNVVHSFVRGVHPNLVSGLLTFEKPIGGIDYEAIARANIHLFSIGMKTKLVQSPESSELAKLLSTTAYAWNIFYADMVNQLCNQFGVDYSEVYTWATESYNKGYTELGMPNVCRPVLTPPDGPIGGHCLLSNIELLPSGSLKELCEQLV